MTSSTFLEVDVKREHFKHAVNFVNFPQFKKEVANNSIRKSQLICESEITQYACTNVMNGTYMYLGGKAIYDVSLN